MWENPTFPTFLTGILEMYGGPWASSVVVHHAADVDRPGQIGIAEPAVQRFQGVGSSCINVDAVPVLVAVVQAGQGQVKGRGFLTAAEHGVGGLGQHLSGSPEADVPPAEETVPQIGGKIQPVPLAGAEGPQEMGQIGNDLLPLRRVGVFGIVADLFVKPVGQVPRTGIAVRADGCSGKFVDKTVHGKSSFRHHRNRVETKKTSGSFPEAFMVIVYIRLGSQIGNAMLLKLYFNQLFDLKVISHN